MKLSQVPARVALAIAALAGVTSMPALAASADGTIDTTFGTNGRTVLGFDALLNAPIDVVLDTVVDGFGRIYLVGVVNTFNGQRIGIARLKKNGQLDTNYGPNDVGLVVAPTQAGFTLTGVSAAVSANGQLLVGGTVTVAGNDDFAVCRFDIDGSLDAFPNGSTCVSVGFDLGGSNDDVLRDIVVQADGKIVMAGSAAAGATSNLAAFARLNTSGNLDTTFNGNGKLSFEGNFGYDDFKINAVKMTTNGKIVAVGEGRTFGDTFSKPAIVRVLANGTPDSTFGLLGVSPVVLSGNRDARLRDLALIPGSTAEVDQKIVAAGEVETSAGSGVYDGLLAQQPIFGGPDSTFGNFGLVIDSTGAALTFNAMQREDNGNLTVVGTIRANTNPSTDLDYYISRYRSDGTRDSAIFNPGFGYKTVDFMKPGGNDLANAVAFQSDRIIIAGASLISTSPVINFDFSAVALLRDRIFANGFD